MRPFIRQGDALREYGGKVLRGRYVSEDKPIACQGDAVQCARHGLNHIAEGSDLMTFDGKPVALEGHACACGCTLVSSMPDSLVAS
ncbi:PAAR domain-containing protein [Pseudomonas sp.]|uniref:PAAR domain-containing protein n=1 Tax=Pseudomonas sp. TaxID=306 RepID=UPI00227A7546|nr:PAAR domain-containing protein [Pseudomonas sp.]WAH60234.1 PAAR domain-containing protein [Pseudomonas silvicola]